MDFNFSVSIYQMHLILALVEWQIQRPELYQVKLMTKWLLEIHKDTLTKEAQFISFDDYERAKQVGRQNKNINFRVNIWFPTNQHLMQFFNTVLY